MKKLRVLYIHHHGTGGGASRSLAFLIRSLPHETVEAHVVTPAGSAVDLFRSVTNQVYVVSELPEITSIAGGRFYTLRLLKTLQNLSSLRRLKEIIAEVNPDIVHLNELSLVLVARLCKQLGYPVVMHARVVLSDKEVLVNKVIKRMILRYTDAVICIDGSVQNKLKPIESSIVYNPLHTKAGESPEGRTNSDGCNVLFLANLIAYKGLFDLLDAAVLLRHEPIQIYIAGSNSRPPAFFRTWKGKLLDILGIVQDNERRMIEVISKKGLTNVLYVGHVANINEWLRKTDILVFPSHMNGPSRSVFEAGAAGIPSILALKDKVQDVITQNVNGLIVSEKKPAELADAIRLLANDRELRTSLGQAARKHFQRLNDPQRSAHDVVDVYQRVLAKR